MPIESGDDGKIAKFSHHCLNPFESILLKFELENNLKKSLRSYVNKKTASSPLLSLTLFDRNR